MGGPSARMPLSHQVPKQYEGSHDIVKGLGTNPPVFLALKKSAILYGNHATGPLAGIPAEKTEERLGAARSFLVTLFQRVWDRTDPNVRAQVLKCWSICCDDKSTDWAKKRSHVAVFIEVSDVQEKYHSVSVGASDCSMEVQLNIEGDEEEKSVPFEMVFEMYGEWFAEHCEPIATGPVPSDKTHQLSPLLDDFPLYLAVRNGAFRGQPQAQAKLTRAFREAWVGCSPAQRSQARSAWGTFWTRKKWGAQDPNPCGYVITSEDTQTDYYPSYPTWDPARRAVVIEEGFVVDNPEHEVMSGFSSVLHSIAEFAENPPRLLPLAIEQAIRKGDPLLELK